MTAEKTLHFIATEEEAGERIDRVLHQRLNKVSRSRIQRMIAQGLLRVDGKPVILARTRATPAARVELRLPGPEPEAEIFAEDLPIDVLYEDEHVLLINKAAGMIVHAAPGHSHGTLVNALLSSTPLAPSSDPMRPGIVHRLDRDTSGVMVVAKTALALAGLNPQFARHTIKRRYWAVVVGTPPPRLSLATLHGRHPVDRKRYTSRLSEGKHAVTHLRKVAQLKRCALLEAHLETGRTHQIRVHCAESGFPVLGDAIYSRPPEPALGRLAPTHLLHALLLGFTHPATGDTMTCVSRPPAPFLNALRALDASPAVFQELEQTLCIGVHVDVAKGTK